jgi:Protocatechuate 3,4-dioxygenase beta subunit N terminal
VATNLINPRDWSSHPAYIVPEYRSTPLRGPTKPLLPLAQSLSELTGPVYGHDSVGPRFQAHDPSLVRSFMVHPLTTATVVARPWKMTRHAQSRQPSNTQLQTWHVGIAHLSRSEPALMSCSIWKTCWSVPWV